MTRFTGIPSFLSQPLSAPSFLRRGNNTNTSTAGQSEGPTNAPEQPQPTSSAANALPKNSGGGQLPAAGQHNSDHRSQNPHHNGGSAGDPQGSTINHINLGNQHATTIVGGAPAMGPGAGGQLPPNAAGTTTPNQNAAGNAQQQQQQQVRPILAERFKTRPCRNYSVTGACPYEVRCMFAHGEGDLRTYEDNIRDGLVTEEAIAAFKEAEKAKAREAALAAMPPPPAYDSIVAAGGSSGAPSAPSAGGSKQQGGGGHRTGQSQAHGSKQQQQQGATTSTQPQQVGAGAVYLAPIAQPQQHQAPHNQPQAQRGQAKGQPQHQPFQQQPGGYGLQSGSGSGSAFVVFAGPPTTSHPGSNGILQHQQQGVSPYGGGVPPSYGGAGMVGYPPQPATNMYGGQPHHLAVGAMLGQQHHQQLVAPQQGFGPMFAGGMAAPGGGGGPPLPTAANAHLHTSEPIYQSVPNSYRPDTPFEGDDGSVSAVVGGGLPSASATAGYGSSRPLGGNSPTNALGGSSGRPIINNNSFTNYTNEPSPLCSSSGRAGYGGSFYQQHRQQGVMPQDGGQRLYASTSPLSSQRADDAIAGASSSLGGSVPAVLQQTPAPAVIAMAAGNSGGGGMLALSDVLNQIQQLGDMYAQQRHDEEEEHQQQQHGASCGGGTNAAMIGGMGLGDGASNFDGTIGGGGYGFDSYGGGIIPPNLGDETPHNPLGSSYYATGSATHSNGAAAAGGAAANSSSRAVMATERSTRSASYGLGDDVSGGGVVTTFQQQPATHTGVGYSAHYHHQPTNPTNGYQQQGVAGGVHSASFGFLYDFGLGGGGGSGGPATTVADMVPAAMQKPTAVQAPNNGAGPVGVVGSARSAHSDGNHSQYGVVGSGISYHGDGSRRSQYSVFDQQ